jgi:hypothetical protein
VRQVSTCAVRRSCSGIGSSKRRDHDISLSGQGQEESRASDHGHCNGCAAADAIHLGFAFKFFDARRKVGNLIV